MAYQNPNHNRANYQTYQDQNPFSGPGPSMSSWQRDMNELGSSLKLNVPVDQKKNDEVQEFKDLFATGLDKINKTSGPKAGMDLSYNPGSLPPQSELSLFPNNPVEESKEDPFLIPFAAQSSQE